jgi:3-dehydroquinate synthase
MAGTVENISLSTEDFSYTIEIGYDILGNLKKIPAYQNADKCAVIISNTVYDLHKAYIDSVVEESEERKIIIFDDSEEHKSYHYAEDFFQKLIHMGLSRKSLLVGIGGGVVGDFTGYLAALYMRGISVIHVPTTLLSMVDSSIGGKAAVNLSVGKNIVGAFHQPKAVISDIRFLETLEKDEMKNGLSEILKHGLIGEKRTMEILTNNDLSLLENKEFLTELVVCSAQFKASVVMEDEKEGGVRAILNFGHTIGHGLESLLEYKNITHGEAVAVGMEYETALSYNKGYLGQKDVDFVKELVAKYNLVRKQYEFSSEELIKHMKYDKKNSDGNINCVLLEKIGKPICNEKLEIDLLKKLFQ